MKTYITQRKPQFRSIRNSNGTTTIECLIVAQLNVAKLQKHFPYLNIKALCHSVMPRYHVFSVHRGYATCSLNDKFDESKGKHLAESRAKTKMYSHYTEMFKHIQTKLKKNWLGITSIRTKILSCFAHEINHVSELVK